MTAKLYNFTKENGVVKKAIKRFTKQNGVVKQILSGWTKTNGVVEQVYASALPPQFITEVSYAPTVIYYVDGTSMVCPKNGDTSSTVVVQNYLDPVPTVYDSGFNPSYTYANRSHIGYYYNAGQPTNSALLTLRSRNYTRLMTSDLLTPLDKLGAVSHGASVPIVMMSSPDTWLIYGIRQQYQSSTGLNTLWTQCAYYNGSILTDDPTVVTPSSSSMSNSLTLSDGRGFFLARVTSTTSSTNDTKTFYMYDYDINSSSSFEQRLSIVPIVTYVGGIGITGSYSYLYTTDGTDVVFSIAWDAYNNSFSVLCRYDPQTKTAMLSSQAQNYRQVIGTYDGYIYVFATTSLATEYGVIEKYDTSFNKIGEHSVPIPAGYSKPSTWSVTTFPTIHSNGRYIGISGIGSVAQVIDLDLF